MNTKNQARLSTKVSSLYIPPVRYLFRLALVFCVCLGGQTLAADWAIEDLGGGTYSVANSINARGQVTGFIGAQSSEAFFYDGTHAIQGIGRLAGATDSVGYYMNTKGQIVGSSGMYANGTYDAFFYNPGNGMFDLGTLGGNTSTAFVINSRGQVAGNSVYPIPPPVPDANGNVDPCAFGGDVTRAFLFDQGTMFNLGSLPATTQTSSAAGMNDNGLIVGYSTVEPANPGDYVDPISGCYIPPFIFHAAWFDGTWHDLGTLGGTHSGANAINTRGQIVGSSNLSGDAATHAFLFEGGMFDIGPPNWPFSVAASINSDGLVVGNMQDATHSGFLYDGATRDLNKLPEIVAAKFTIAAALGINDSGQIAGYGNKGGQTHAYRLHPQSMSRYMQTVDPNTLYNLGCSQTNQRGIAVLDFGEPKFDGTNYGASVFRTNGTFATIADIEQAVRAFLGGYYVCNGRPGHGILTVAVGTTNHGTKVSNGHGRAWGEMMTRLNAFISTPPSWTDRLSVVGAIDIEQGNPGATDLTSAAVATGWVHGYASATLIGYVNYGAANSCPTSGTGPCANGWSQADIQYVSWGTAISLGPVPEIYFNVPPGLPSNALQWTTLATLGSSTQRFFPGALTQWQACHDPQRKCSATNTPLQAWQQLMDALYKAPVVQPKLYSSDITWQN